MMAMTMMMMINYDGDDNDDESANNIKVHRSDVLVSK
jgi:hypothetical protein